MLKSITMSVLLAAILLQTSCALFKNSYKDKAFCSSAAFIDTSKVKPVAPQTTSDKEFHAIAGVNIQNHHRVIVAYDNLRECWDYFVEDKKPKQK